MVKDYNDYMDILKAEFPDIDPSDITLALSHGCVNMSRFLRTPNGFDAFQKIYSSGFKTSDGPQDEYNPVRYALEARKNLADKISIMLRKCNADATGEVYCIIRSGLYRSIMFGMRDTINIHVTSQKEVAALRKTNRDIVLELFDFEIPFSDKFKMSSITINADDFPEHRIVMGHGILSLDVIGTRKANKIIKYDNLYSKQSRNGSND